MKQPHVLALSGALFLGSSGAFFLFVPLMSVATTVLVLGGLMLMFRLGFQAGAREMTPLASVEDAAVVPG